MGGVIMSWMQGFEMLPSARRGISGGRAVAERLAQVAPKSRAAGASAQFKALEKTDRGRGYLNAAGVSATSRTQLSWLSGESAPGPANSRAISAAYDTWRRDNMSRRLGRRIEVYPDPDIARQSGGAVRTRDLDASPEEWDELIEAWQSGDAAAMDRAWNRMVSEQVQDSPPGRAYFTVSHVWFSGDRNA
jgi:hypothetical protein